ncbi:cell division protein FtsX [Chitinophaga caeni]|uniref:Cell division protein FtsX n=1 Tax=Chitinophaga caeni TaxID=2029983 RepID=A0A291QSF1_9BACT|nr:ABC transporter permease [Chitinophaga caeni]ATL46831.1 cell division protein FtsX [Chitinophaga caeni]
MLRNYMKIAWRNIQKNKAFSFINILGLAIGISAAIVIYMMVRFETTYEAFLPDGNRIYRIVSNIGAPSNYSKNAGVPAPVFEAVPKEISGIASVAPLICSYYQTKVTIPGAPDKLFIDQSHIVLTNSQYFDIVPYKWLAGSAGALNEPYNMVLDADRAKEYFGDISPAAMLGKVVTYNDTVHYTVSGIVAPLKGRTDFTFQDFISWKTPNTSIYESWSWGKWTNTSDANQLLIKTNPGVTAENINQQLAKLRARNVEGPDSEGAFILQPIKEMHFDNGYDNFNQHQASKTVFKGLFIVAICLLTLACINFINLNTAQGSIRTKEIGIRKSLGSSRLRLILQFLGESTLLTFLAALLSLAFIPVLLNLFQEFLPVGMTWRMLLDSHIIAYLLLLIVTVSILAGLYPALVLSRLKPILILRNRFLMNNGKRRFTLRQVLTVAQFTIAIVFIVGTLTVSKQLKYVLSKDLGYQRDAIVQIQMPWRGNISSAKSVMMNSLAAMPAVKSISTANAAPIWFGSIQVGAKATANGKDWEGSVQQRVVDEHYIDLFELKLVAGRNFLPSDSSKELIINESFAKELGFKQPADALLQTIDGVGGVRTVVGVLKDFNFRSLHEKIAPLAMYPDKYASRAIFVKLNPPKSGEGWGPAIKQLQELTDQQFPFNINNVEFFDQKVKNLYSKERQVRYLLAWSCGLMIFISCMGLLGLAIHSTKQRTKEIGIRKVLGASVMGILSLLSREFILLVIIALFIATPIAWYYINQWLQEYAYRVTVNGWIFLLSGLGALLIAILTVSYQAIRAATMNPVISLKDE